MREGFSGPRLARPAGPPGEGRRPRSGQLISDAPQANSVGSRSGQVRSELANINPADSEGAVTSPELEPPYGIEP